MLEKTERLLTLATAIVSLTSADPGQFVAQTEEYLDLFQRWQQELEQRGSATGELPLQKAERERFQKAVEELSALHYTIIERANSLKASVAAEMGDIHRKAQGMKAYVDRLPSRITIAGKRKG